MNEQLEKSLSKVIEKSLELAEKTGQFALDQAPELLQEFYRWHMIKSIMLILLGVSLILSVRYIPIMFLHKEKPEGRYTDYRKYFGMWGDEFSVTMISAFGGITVLCSFLFAICPGIYDLAFILSVPKLYLIEYFIK